MEQPSPNQLRKHTFWFQTWDIKIYHLDCKPPTRSWRRRVTGRAIPHHPLSIPQTWWSRLRVQPPKRLHLWFSLSWHNIKWYISKRNKPLVTHQARDMTKWKINELPNPAYHMLILETTKSDHQRSGGQGRGRKSRGLEWKSHSHQLLDKPVSCWTCQCLQQALWSGPAR